jgi:hypothetical protein
MRLLNYGPEYFLKLMNIVLNKKVNILKCKKTKKTIFYNQFSSVFLLKRGRGGGSGEGVGKEPRHTTARNPGPL